MALRKEGIALIGSGSLTHNLYPIQWQRRDVAQYAVEFQNWVRRHIETRALASLVAAASQAPGFHDAHPSDDHYLSLLFAIEPPEAPQFIGQPFAEFGAA